MARLRGGGASSISSGECARRLASAQRLTLNGVPPCRLTRGSSRPKPIRRPRGGGCGGASWAWAGPECREDASHPFETRARRPTRHLARREMALIARDTSQSPAAGRRSVDWLGWSDLGQKSQSSDSQADRQTHGQTNGSSPSRARVGEFIAHTLRAGRPSERTHSEANCTTRAGPAAIYEP